MLECLSMKRLLLDGREIKGVEQLHDILTRELQLPDYYGRNLDALWLCRLTVKNRMGKFQRIKRHLRGVC
ncbi:barstar family protein [Salinithrix halophila]|uniref:Barstar family protein n=1 Tax=Salinithrix halophila TaxID=1485204 RepID=A0ABV8JGU6_9BACL